MKKYLILFSTIIAFIMLYTKNIKAQSGDSCITAVNIQTWLNSSAANIEMQNQTNWFYFNNDSTNLSFYIFKSDLIPNEGKVNQIQVFKGVCDSLVLLFDTTIIHGANNIKFGVDDLSPGIIYVKLTNLDTINCIPCIDDYNLKLWLKNAQFHNIVWPMPNIVPCPNIVLNPGFEDITGTSICQGISTFLNNWNEIDSPDWFSIGNTGCSSSSIPTSTWFTTIPNPPSPSITAPNNSYIGVATAVWQNNTAWNTGWTEIAMQDLPTTLTLNKRYLVRTKVALAANTRFTSNNMNVKVGNDNTFNSAPQLSAPMLTNPNNWLQLENTFLSDGTENKVFVGNNMITSTGMNTVTNEINPTSLINMAYYFADDIELYRMADAGPDVTISTCSPPQIGTCAIPGAAYLWTPATGLSSAVSAQPFAMPTQTTQYVVRVVYWLLNGNTAIDYDTVIVTVPPCNCFANAGPDITILDCTPDTIGPDCINPNLSYSWSPTIGLDNPNVANPLALPVSNTTYVLTVTYTDPNSGYTFLDYDTVNVNINTQACINTITPHIISPNIYANNLGNALSTNANYALDGTININIPNFTIANIDLVLGPNTQIVVFPGCSLTITDSYLHGCCAMWHGIKVMQNATLNIISNSVIEDADTAVTITFNGTYQLSNTVFNKNYVDVAAIGTINFNQTATVENCTFDFNDTQMPGTYSPYGLRPPMIGQRSAIAIIANDVNPLTIGSSGANANFFYNHDFGLFIKNVNLVANYNTFKNIDDNSINTYSFTTPKGINIHLENTNNGNYQSVIEYNNFDIGVTAINAFNGYNGRYLHNSISNMSNFGIVFFENPKKDFRIFFNNIDNVGWVGIQGLNNYNASIGIHGNVLNNSLNKLFRTAIAVDELVTSSTSMPAYSIQINHNTINNYQYGITTTRLRGPRIMSNMINIQQTPWGLYSHGIRLFENFRADIIGNTIFGNNRDEYFVDGIRNDQGSNAQIKCNYTVKTGSGAFFAGSGISAGQLHSNIFLKDFWGVVLANQAKIGTQGFPAGNESYANQWIGSMGNPDYAHTFAYDANGNFSPFFTLAGYPWEPSIATWANTGQSTPWGAVSNNQNDNCLLYRDSIDTNVVIISPIHEPINEVQILQQINSAQSNSYTASQAWWLRASAYSRLEDEDASSIQNFDLVLFKDSVDSAALGKLTHINKMLSDTIFEDIDSLRAANNAVGTNSNVEILLKTVNELNMLRIKNGKLQSEELDELRNIAAMCPFEEGPAVYTARALLRGIDAQRQEYMHECEKVYPSSVSSRESKPEIENNDLVSVNNDFSVTPNPAKNMININHNGKFSDFYIEEISGKIVLSERLNQNLNTEQLDVSFLANGLYLAKLKIENDIKIVKLIINK